MTYFILNNINNQNQLTQGVGISKDLEIIWSGESLEEFELKTGLTWDLFGGFVLENNLIIFNQQKKDEYERFNKRWANGKDLITFIEQTKSSLKIVESWDLLDKLAPFFVYLRQSRANPMTVFIWEKTLNRINTKIDFTEKEKSILISILETWIQDKKFDLRVDSEEIEEKSKKKIANCFLPNNLDIHKRKCGKRAALERKNKIRLL